jgi:hypothetical protein
MNDAVTLDLFMDDAVAVALLVADSIRKSAICYAELPGRLEDDLSAD